MTCRNIGRSEKRAGRRETAMSLTEQLERAERRIAELEAELARALAANPQRWQPRVRQGGIG